MSQAEAIRTLEAMGFRPSVEGATCHLHLEGQRLSLAAGDWDNVLVEARLWLDRLGDDAARDGERLAARRRVVGFPDFEEFTVFTGLDPSLTFEAEAGLQPPQGVHLRILDWLESGKLSR